MSQHDSERVVEGQLPHNASQQEVLNVALTDVADAYSLPAQSSQPPPYFQGQSSPADFPRQKGSSPMPEPTGEGLHRLTNPPSGTSRHSPEDYLRTFHRDSLLDEMTLEEAPPYEESYNGGPISHTGTGIERYWPVEPDVEVQIDDDGRIKMNIQESRLVSNLLNQVLPAPSEKTDMADSPSIHNSISQTPRKRMVSLNIVMHVMGSHDDVQPFIALGQFLKNTCGHRIRLATHPIFQTFVEENGLEFFSIGGNPVNVMTFMVKNPGLLERMNSQKAGEFRRRQKEMQEVLGGCWRSCFEAGDGTGAQAFDDESVGDTGFKARPFVADVIIANPPSSAHVHCAEKLGIPLHIIFTMPWSPTQEIPHPLAHIVSSNTGEPRANFISYALVEVLMWQGLGSVINRFREKTLGLETIDGLSGPGIAGRLRIPHTYLWSPELVPKPEDWDKHVSVSGFCLLPPPSDYTPEPNLASFLDNGPPPVYIGFGSISIDNPNALTELIFAAIKKTGQRAVISRGWGGLGEESFEVPEDVFMFGSASYEWLFQRVSCVVHNGSAVTTSAGIAAGKPTVVVPFVGDQPFWGWMVANAGASPIPIPFKQLTAENLAASISEALKPKIVNAARELGAKVAAEKGCEKAADSLHDELNLDTLRCDVAPGRAAVWRVKATDIKLSAFAAALLSSEGLLNFNDLKQYRPREYEIDQGASTDPVSGSLGAILGAVGGLMLGMIDNPAEVATSAKSSTVAQVQTKRHSLYPAEKSDTRAHLAQPSSSQATGMGSDEGPSRERSASSNRAQVVDDRSPDQSKLDDIPLSLASRSSQASDSTVPVSPESNTATGLSEPQSIRSTTDRPNSIISVSSSGHSISGIQTQASLEDDPSHKGKKPATPGAGKSLNRIADMSLKVPVAFTMGITSGFHNAPKLYGDDTVRPNYKVTGFNSGVAAASKEFVLGTYDGVAGIFTQPVIGAKKDGVAGFFKGIGKGLAGSLIKPSSALMGIPGYTFKGIYKEIQNQFGAGTQSYILAARTTQGLDECNLATQEERSDVIRRWQSAALENRKKRPGLFSRWQSLQNSRKESKKDLRNNMEDTDRHELPAEDNELPIVPELDSTAQLLSSSQIVEQLSLIELSSNPTAVSRIGTREPTLEPQEPSTIPPPPPAAELATNPHWTSPVTPPPQKPTTLPRIPTRSPRRVHKRTEETTTSGDDQKHALDFEDDVGKALEASKLDAEEEARSRTEEEIVLDYVKRQSLAEEKHRLARLRGRDEREGKGADEAGV